MPLETLIEVTLTIAVTPNIESLITKMSQKEGE